MSVDKHDPFTGHKLTGHEWNGITELNTAVPKAVWIFLGLAFVVSVIYWVLMPAWPIGTTYTKGLLGINQHTRVDKDIRQARAGRAVWTQKIATDDFKAIAADPALMKIVRETGRTLFEDNCGVCHGLQAQGGPGFPDLKDKSWLWGGTPEAVFETIRVGVNSAHPDSRVSQMPAFGKDQMLPREAILNVVAYVQSLSKPALSKPGSAPDSQLKAIAAGHKIFTDNCVACHGEGGIGNIEMGAPNLTDKFWLYGGDLNTIFTTVWGGRQGHMPTWEARLTNVQRKILTLYVLDLGAQDAKIIGEK